MRAWAANPEAGRELEVMERAWRQSLSLERSIDLDAAWRSVATAMHVGERRQEQEQEQEQEQSRESWRVAGVRDKLRLHRPDGATVHDVRGHARRVRVLRPALDSVARSSRTTRIATYAAAAAVLLATSATLVRGTWTSNSADAGRVASGARTVRDFVAKPGQRAIIDLEDGTHIVLAPASRLHVSLPVGGSGERDLTLDGEAMFTVTHDAARPFVVHSRYGTTLDIGTSFAVRAYESQPYRVVVRDGRVSLGNRLPVLVAGDVASREVDGTMRVVHGQDADALLDWTTGKLSFQHTRFADLVPELEHWYGVTIRIATPELRDRVITGQLDTESRSEAMSAIGRTLGAQHMIQGTRVTFSLRGDVQ